MAVEVYEQNMADLRPAGTTTKRNFNTALATGPFSGDVCGHWRAFFITLPGYHITSNQRIALAGYDAAGTGTFAGGADWVMRIPGKTLGSPTNIRMRPQVREASGGTSAWAGTEGNITTVPEMLHSLVPVTYLYLMGVTNINTNASPTWRNWAAICPVGGTASSEVAATASAAAFISGTTQVLMSQLLGRISTVAPFKGTRMAQYAHANGDFPWDTVNNRPSHEVIQALARSSGSPTLTYETMIAGQNANSLSAIDYPNLRVENGAQGKGELLYRYTLADMSGGLTNTGSAANGNLSLQGTAGGIIGVANIEPQHWLGNNPTIAMPPSLFVNTGGLSNFTFSGTYQSGTTTMERRWLYDVNAVNSGAVAGNVVPGFDWADIATVSGGNWSFDENPTVGGPYILEVRDKVDTARIARCGGWVVGTDIAMHGQSSMAQVTSGDGDTLAPLGTNAIGLTVDATARGTFIVLNNARGGTAATYAQPVIQEINLDQGITPGTGRNNCGQGSVAMLNAWNALNPRHPLRIVNIAIGGTDQADWANNTTVTTGNASWKFMGAVGVLPDNVSGNNSGVMEYYARYCGRRIMRHILAWTPGLSGVASGVGSRELYYDETTTRFSNTPSAPWIIPPMWRTARDPVDDSGNPTKREEHVEYVNEINALPGGVALRAPCWNDTLMTGDVGHSAWRAADGTINPPGDVQPGDQDREGQSRLGYSIAWALAWSFDPTVKAHGPRVVSAWTDNSCATINIELGRQVRALDGEPLTSRDFWVSLNNGVTWFRGNDIAGDPAPDPTYVPAVTFTATFEANNTRAVLTPADGGTAWEAARALGNLKFDYGWAYPYYWEETGGATGGETVARPLLYRVPRDNMTYRGSINVTGDDAGNPLQGTSTSAAGSGLAVTSGTPVAKLVTMERFTGTRNVTIRMMASDGVTVLKEKTVTITAS
jgi:hypothetical protein